MACIYYKLFLFIKTVYCIFVTDSHYSAYKQNEGVSYLYVYILGLIYLIQLLQDCKQPAGGRGYVRRNGAKI